MEVLGILFGDGHCLHFKVYAKKFCVIFAVSEGSSAVLN